MRLLRVGAAFEGLQLGETILPSLHEVVARPPGATAAERAAVRSVWQQSCNNPACGFEDQGQGVFFRARIGGVILFSGDRHGARVLRIPRPSGFSF